MINKMKNLFSFKNHQIFQKGGFRQEILLLFLNIFFQITIIS